jgi:hypothetical protein
VSSIAIFTILHKNKQNTTAFTEIKNLNFFFSTAWHLSQKSNPSTPW